MLATLQAILFFIIFLCAAPEYCLASHEKIRVVMDDYYPPYVFKDQSGELKGITIDQWRLWEKKTGIKIEITSTDWNVAQQRMQAGEFDVIDTIFKNEKREKIYEFSKPYIDLPVPLFVHKDIKGIRGVQDLKGFKVGVKAGDASFDELTKNGVDSIAEYSSYEQIVKEAKNGKLKVFTIDRPPALYYLNKLGIADQFNETKPMYTGQFHRAVLKGKIELLNEIEAGFNKISKQEYEAIDKLWTGAPLSPSPYIRYIRYILLSVAGILAFLGIWLWALKKSVHQKTNELASSHKRFQAIFDYASDAIFIHNSVTGKILDVNQRMTDLYGFTKQEALQMTIVKEISSNDSSYTTDNALNLIHKAANGEPQLFEWHTRHKDGHLFWVEVSMRLANLGDDECVIALVRNIDERKKAEVEKMNVELQLRQTQKLESLGVLAGGIAHDFNNILMAIMGNAELAKMRINLESPAVENLERIEVSAARAADLAKQMLAYSGKGKFIVEQINLNGLLEEMLHLLEVSISKKAILRLNLHEHLPTVKADATQMRQIVMNLVINASEAIGAKSGVIAITTGCMDCDSSYLKDIWLDENLKDGLYVYLEIADTGCGMDKETLGKLFDPFFTTKFTGRGLGMSAVLGIVRGHNGAIKVYSEVGKGTSFKILLPASNKPVELFNGHNVNHDWKGSGTILLVDDEESVRGIGTEMLKELGYTAITATDGRDALEKFKTHPEINFVIMDLTMPKMDGEQCFRELRILKPDVKVIMSSGYSEQEVCEKFIGKGLAGFIQKPYKLSVLKDVIKKIE